MPVGRGRVLPVLLLGVGLMGRRDDDPRHRSEGRTGLAT